MAVRSVFLGMSGFLVHQNPCLIYGAPSGIKDFKVRESSSRWHKSLIEVLFLPKVVSRILAIHAPRVKIGYVIMYWTLSKHGDFLVKSAYFLAVMAGGLWSQPSMRIMRYDSGSTNFVLIDEIDLVSNSSFDFSGVQVRTSQHMGRRKEEIMELGNLGTDSLGNLYGLWAEDEFNRGFQLDYIFDWTILEYQQSQIAAPPSRALGPGTGRSSRRPPLVANAQRLSGEKEGRLPGLSLVDYESALKGIESLHFDDKERFR
ncbi:hypothetical protein RHGRI_012999 [Rhododendron griersonianum]|uniref:Uncharacterized protein n=1 Tax=Rhododendron griersonianum TaxID=479676 RepID=A0AAV6K485_9ERIC|nr:hypothetical protein RHGRI_012999 [Rhododendron griersonianum]